MSHTALLPLSYSTALCFTDENTLRVLNACAEFAKEVKCLGTSQQRKFDSTAGSAALSPSFLSRL